MEEERYNKEVEIIAERVIIDTWPLTSCPTIKLSEVGWRKFNIMDRIKLGPTDIWLDE